MTYPEIQAARPDTATLPIIDLTLLDSPEGREQLARQLDRACRDSGFFYVAGHGVAPELTTEVFRQSRALFALPEQQKQQINKSLSPANRGYEPLQGQTLEPGSPPDLKEGFYIGEDLDEKDPRVQAGRFNHGPNQWPESLPEFAPVMQRYFHTMNRLSTRIMEALALALELPADHFRDFCQQPLSTLRLLHYPPQPASPAPGEKGCGAHTDFGGITVLLLDEHPGLQVWDSQGQSWIQAPPIPGTFGGQSGRHDRPLDQ